MKAVILVGGLGTRLRPLTCNRPKPMLPIVNRPFIEHMLLRLRDQGIEEVALAVQYLADQFRTRLGDGTTLGMRIQIVEEPEPRGTAGAVKHVAHLLDGTTFVLNGDTIIDLDFQAMLAYHRAQGSKLTLALAPVADPTSFGLVETNPTGKVQRFLEKPRPEEITTDLINAGVYLLEPDLLAHVPDNQFFMFEKGLFPDLLKHGTPMYGYRSDSYWNDIGKPQTYLDMHRDILLGKTRFALPGREVEPGVWAEGEIVTHAQARLQGPLVFGPHIQIGANSSIIGPSVLGAGCTIGTNVRIENAVLWDGITVEDGATLRNCIIGQNTRIGMRTRVEEGAVIGDNCSIGADNILSHGMRISPHTTLPDTSIFF